ncbi:hypothetical protein V8F33_005249 [Rhypophila sp. PSN 637]
MPKTKSRARYIWGACEPCRFRKRRCDRKEPVCSACKVARTILTCIYPTATSDILESKKGEESLEENMYISESKISQGDKGLLEGRVHVLESVRDFGESLVVKREETHIPSSDTHGQFLGGTTEQNSDLEYFSHPEESFGALSWASEASEYFSLLEESFNAPSWAGEASEYFSHPEESFNAPYWAGEASEYFSHPKESFNAPYRAGAASEQSQVDDDGSLIAPIVADWTTDPELLSLSYNVLP